MDQESTRRNMGRHTEKTTRIQRHTLRPRQRNHIHSDQRTRHEQHRINIKVHTHNRALQGHEGRNWHHGWEPSTGTMAGGPWRRAMAMSHDPGTWDRAMATGHGHEPFPLAMTISYDQDRCTGSMATSHGESLKKLSKYQHKHKH